MSDLRRPLAAIQLQLAGLKAAHAEIFPAALWNTRDNFKALYPPQSWDSLLRIRYDGRWVWCRDGFPFLHVSEVWHMLAHTMTSHFNPEECNLILPCPEWAQPKAPIYAMIEGMLTKTHIKEVFHASSPLCCWHVHVIGCSLSIPVNAIFPDVQ